MYGRKSDAIVGYDFNAAHWCPTHLIEALIQRGRLSPGARGMREEDALDQLAAVEGVDREDEHSFDSGDFPKVILSIQLGDGETCDWDGHSLHD